METPLMRTNRLWAISLALGFYGLGGPLYARDVTREADGPKDRPAKAPARADKQAKAAEDKAAEPGAGPASKDDIVAKVDDITITRADLAGARRLFALTNPQANLNNKQLLDQLISRTLWSRYFAKKGFYPAPQDLEQAVAQMDAELRKKGSDYRTYLATLGLSPQEHRPLLSYDIAMQVLVRDIQMSLDGAELKAEFNDHPDWYDGSRIRLSQIFIDTSAIANDPKEMDKAKQRIDQLYAKATAPGADFDRIARDYSEGGAGGDRGWLVRKGPNVDETLIKAVWGLKVGDCTKPILGPAGWQILKVTEREPAALTFHGCKQQILNELTRRRLEALLGELKAAAKIEIFF